MKITQSHRAKNTTDILCGIPWKQLLKLFFPILLGTFFQQLYNTIDAVIVGQFLGKEALAAVAGGTGVLINLLVGFFIGLSVGATVIISQFYGAKNDREVHTAVHTAFALAITGGIIISIVSIWYSPVALKLIGTPQSILAPSLTYIRIYFAGIIFVTVYNMGAGILRAIGDTRRPLYFLIIGTIVNIILDLLFIGLFGWGIAGAAWATVLSQCTSMVLTCFSLIKTRDSYKLTIRKIGFSLPMLKNMLRIGFPTGIQSVLYSFSNILIQAHINALGTNTVAAWAAFGRIDSLHWMVLNAFGISLTTFVGQNYGAKKYKRMLTGTGQCIIMAGITTAALAIILCVFAEYAYVLFTDDATVISEGVIILRFLAPFFILFVPIEILTGALRGAGKTFMPTVISATGICFIRVIWLTLAVPQNRSLFAVLFSYPMTWFITATWISVYFLRKKWLPDTPKFNF